MASQCYMAGRIEAAVRYSDAGQTVLGNGRGEVPYGLEGWLGGAYVYIGQPERWVEWCRAQLARGRDTHTLTRASLVIALKIAGSEDEAMAAAKGLIDAAEATHNPWALSLALLAYGSAFLDADPDRAREAMRRGVVIAQDSGNRTIETYLASSLARLEAQHGDPLAALDYFLVSIRHLHDSGNSTTIRAVLAALAALFNRLGHYEVAATMSRIRRSCPYSRSVVPEINTAITHLREVLGDETYESLSSQRRTDDHRRDGHLRTRPNRPGPNRTERGLEIHVFRESRKSVSIAALKMARCDILCGCPVGFCRRGL